MSISDSINNIDLIANYLNYSRYYSKLNNKDKDLNLNSFLNSKEDYFKILVSSSSLEEDFNYSFIRLVIYKNITYFFISFL